jgi:hypothetical protein
MGQTRDIVTHRLVSGQIVTLDGYVMSAGPDPADPGRVRLVLARALGFKDERPDQRDIVLSCHLVERPCGLELGARHEPWRDSDETTGSRRR